MGLVTNMFLGLEGKENCWTIRTKTFENMYITQEDIKIYLNFFN
jgi:hypothetical protein